MAFNVQLSQPEPAVFVDTNLVVPLIPTKLFDWDGSNWIGRRIYEYTASGWIEAELNYGNGSGWVPAT